MSVQLDLLTDDARLHLDRVAGAIEMELLNHIEDSEQLGSTWPSSRAVSSYLSSMREQFMEHMVEAVGDWQPEPVGEWMDGQSHD